MKKRTVIVSFTIVTAAIAVLAAFLLGAFVYPYSIQRLTEVPEFDVLEYQFAREMEILSDYSGHRYTIDDPYIIADPYNMNPLCALIMFETETESEVDIVIAGDDEHSTFTYTHSAAYPRAEIPIIGMYAGRANHITLIVDGRAYEHIIRTEPLPVDFPDYALHYSSPGKMAPGVTLLTAIFESYSPFLDNNAHVRGFLSNKRYAHGTTTIMLKNGNMLSTGDEFKQIPYHKAFLIEYNWLGKIFRIYNVPNGVHHSIHETPNGDILAVSNNADMYNTGTREDVVIIIDRETGEVKKSYDYRTILDETREPYHHFHSGIVNAPIRDWMHANSSVYDPVHNAIITSSPTQSAVVSIDADAGSINWILGPHDGYSDGLREYLLTPIGDDFEWSWAQHDVRLLETDEPGFVDIVLFDNGQSRSFYKDTAVAAADNYSRAVVYRIDPAAMTVEQLRQFGKELGSDYYAAYLGNAQHLGDTILVNFGGLLKRDGIPSDDLMQSVMGGMVTNSHIVEVTQGGDVVFSVSVHENEYTQAAGTYHAMRMPLFSRESYKVGLGEMKGERIGSPYICPVPEDIEVPLIYMGRLSAEFSFIYREDDRLVIDGVLYNGGTTRLISKVYVVLRSGRGLHVYEANSGLNGRFFLSVDLSELPAGEYQITVIGATVEGNDALGKRSAGYFATDYKVTVLG